MRLATVSHALLSEAANPAAVDAVFPPPQRKSLCAPVAALRNRIPRAAGDERERFPLRNVGFERDVARDSPKVVGQGLAVPDSVNAGFRMRRFAQRRAVADCENFGMRDALQRGGDEREAALVG